MKNAVVIGGTDMLTAATRWTMRHAEHTTVIGRSQHRLDQLREGRGTAHTNCVSLDYRDSAALEARLEGTAGAYGPIDLVVSWIHSTAPEAIPTIAEQMRRSASGWRFVHVKGSASDIAAIRAAAPTPQGCVCRQVLLGYQLDAGRSRWLTDRENSNGVIQAIEQDADVTVGQLEPWSERPWQP